LVGAVRVASLMLTTEAMVVDEQKKEKDEHIPGRAASPYGGDDMDY
jgi:hypothetical protein